MRETYGVSKKTALAITIANREKALQDLTMKTDTVSMWGFLLPEHLSVLLFCSSSSGTVEGNV